MFTLGIPKRDYRRATQVLGYEAQAKDGQSIEFDVVSDKNGNPIISGGFYQFEFPDTDEKAFSDIAIILKKEGVRAIGADEALTERNIMKLANLITEDFSKNLDESDSDTLIQALKNTLEVWESKSYANDRARWEEYYMDIEELIEDFEEERSMDTPTPSQLTNLQERKVRKLIRKTIRQ